MNEHKNNTNDESKEKQKKIIPLHKAYSWGIIICAACLVGLVLYNNLHPAKEPEKPLIDYLALLRDSHERAIALRGVVRIGDRNLDEFETAISSQIGLPVIFPDWIALLPSVKIIGARVAKVGSDQTVNLLFTLNNQMIDYITIYNSKQEISELETVKLDDFNYHVYKWGTFRGYFWELTEDRLPYTYGLISDMDQEELEMLVADTMRSLKNYYLPK